MESMAAIRTNNLSDQLQHSAFERITHSVFNLQTSLTALEKILLEISPVRKAWGPLSKVLQLVACANIGFDTI